MKLMAGRPIPYVLVVLAMVVVLLIPPGWNLSAVAMEGGRFDLTVYNLEEHVLLLTGDWDYYPNGHYSGADIARGTAGAALPSSDFRPSEVRYGTYRAVFHVEPGKTYAVSARNQMLCEQMFVDGKLIGTVGKPGLTRDDSVPGIGYYLYFFTPQGSTAEIVVNFSTFHVDYGVALPSVMISSGRTLLSYACFKLFRDCFLLGAMLMAFVFFMSGHLFGGMKPYAMYFSLTSLAIGVHVFFRTRFLTGALNLPWEATAVGEYLMMLMMVGTLAVYINALYPGVFHRVVYRFLHIVTVLYGIVILTTDTLVFPHLMFPYQAIVAVIGLYVLARVIRPALAQGAEGKLFLAGFGLFMAFAILDILYLNHLINSQDFNFVQIGMLFFVCLHAAAIMISFSRREDALNNAKNLEFEQNRANEMLLRLNNMKASFIATVSHEMRTPLTIISGHAEIMAKKIEDRPGKEEQLGRLETIASEANRLGALVGNLMQLSKWMDSKDRKYVNLSEIVERTAYVYEPLVEKKGNSLKVSVESDLPEIYVNPDRVTQVIINLLSNANAHTHRGTIQMRTSGSQSKVFMEVADNGEGIAQEDIPHLFTRQPSGQTSGLGLSICKEIVEGYGGEIALYSEIKKGTRVVVAFPTGGKEEEEVE